MANTKNYTENGGSVTHIGGELVLDPGSKVIKDGQEVDIGGAGLPEVEGSGKVIVSVDGEWKEQDGYGYTESGKIEISNEVVTTISDEVTSLAQGMFLIPFSLVPGKEYEVSFEGNKYNVIAKHFEVEGSDYLGELDFDTYMPIFDNYPFVVMSIDASTDLACGLLTQTAGDYEIKITTDEEIVHPIDNKYLSETTVSLIEMNIRWGENDDYWVVVSAPNANTIAQNILNGKYYILRITSNKYDSITGEDVIHTNFLNVAQVRHELINDTLAHEADYKPITIAGISSYITMDYFDDSWHWDLGNYQDD